MVDDRMTMMLQSVIVIIMNRSYVVFSEIILASSVTNHKEDNDM